MKKEKTVTCVSRQQLIRFKGMGFTQHSLQPCVGVGMGGRLPRFHWWDPEKILRLMKITFQCYCILSSLETNFSY